MISQLKFSVLVGALLRFAALCWLLSGLSALGNAISVFNVRHLSLGTDLLQSLLVFIGPSFSISFGVIAWAFAGAISKRLIAGPDVEVEVKEIREAQLYTFGFLAVGLYFFLSYLGGFLNWLQVYSGRHSFGPTLVTIDDGRNDDLYRHMISSGVPVLCGALSLFLAPQLGRRMTRAAAKSAAAEAARSREL